MQSETELRAEPINTATCTSIGSSLHIDLQSETGRGIRAALIDNRSTSVLAWLSIYALGDRVTNCADRYEIEDCQYNRSNKQRVDQWVSRSAVDQSGRTQWSSSGTNAGSMMSPIAASVSIRHGFSTGIIF